MTPVYLHIGTHKTGTTSIQRFLARADDALDDQGILYPETGRPDTNWSNQYGHHELGGSLAEERGKTTEQVWRDLRTEIHRGSQRIVILSAEDFETMETPSIRRALSHLEPHPVRLILYLRPPIDFLRSAYTQRVKMGAYSEPFVCFVKEMTGRCKYIHLVSRWEQFDQVESLNILLFDKVKKDPGLEASFAKVVGIDREIVNSFAGPIANPSPSEELIQVARWINRVSELGVGSGGERSLVRRARGNVLDRRWPGRWLASAMHPFLRDSLVTDRACNILRESVADAHEHFLEKYVPPEDRRYLSL